MARQQNRGGGGNNQQHQQMQANDAMSAQQKLDQVLLALEERGDELAGVLPRDVSLVAFLANVNQALRNNPKLLRCTFASIVNACVKAAYDGLRIDGKEAAIVDAEERYQDGNGAWKSRAVARYMPMVFGLIKQILQSGAALSVKAVIVFRRELTEISPLSNKPRFMLLEGTTPGIHHEPLLEGDKGDMVGAYAIAEIQAGVFKFEWMDRAAIQDVQSEAKTKKVWDRWPTEMWKKTVIRRLRKSLSGTSTIRDMEAAEMFPQFDRTAPHPQFAPPAGARPTRAMLSNQAGTENGVAMDWGSDGEVVDQERDEQRHDQRPQQQRQEAPRDDRQQQPPSIQLPEDDRAWAIWGTTIERDIGEARSVEDVDRVWSAAQPIYKHASKTLRDRLTSKVTERNTELALGEDDGAGAGVDE